MFERFTDRGRRVVFLAQEEARMLNHNHIGTEHILLGLIHEGKGVAAKALESFGISLEAVRQQVEEIIGQGQQTPPAPIPFTPRAKKVLELSLREALQLGQSYIGTEHLLLALLRKGDGVGVHALVKLGVDLNRVHSQVHHMLREDPDKEAAPAADSTETAPFTFRAPDQFGRSLTDDAREGKLDPVIGREKEIARVIQVLARLTRNNPVLVGVHGAGKTSVLRGLARQIVRGQVPQRMTDKLIYRVNVESLAENSGTQDDVKRYLHAVVQQARSRADVILFLDGLGALPRGLWGTLRPLLSRGELQIIGALTQTEYDDLLNEHGALERAFVPIHVAEPTVGQTIEILKGLRDRYEAYHQVVFTDGALIAAAEAASTALPGEQLPGKAVDLLDEAASLRRMRVETTPTVGEWEVVAEVNEDLIAEALSIMLGLSSDGAAEVRAALGAEGPRFAPAGMTAEDLEIWGMA